MTKQEFIQWAKSHGWVEDKQGHLGKVISEGIILRLKINSVVVSYEKRIKYNSTEFSQVLSDWSRIGRGYFKDLSINSKNDKLVGLKR